ncbi:phosphohistidine phosphatase SixA [Salinicola sp. DM10]|uniref:phosphohistidine phosphatase SixA n=1 Tax=Salinicola sp. DM10 TaxID=2815721 RepID=UPI001A8D93FD|nr:phosphohistidine phosphatase SixA [Salinicola sp. DM10]MCE3026129.1 phosphohistidine phosphatase SixA [Salinicola sp. DM10]
MSWLAIVRHGEAGPGVPDAERCLTARGEGEAQSAARWLASRPELAAATLWASPYRRAQQTAQPIAAALGIPVDTRDGMTPEDDVAALIERLSELGASPAPLILVSHMPLVGTLAGRLVDGGPLAAMGFPTAGVALLEGEVWAAGCARLGAFVAPPHG